MAELTAKQHKAIAALMSSASITKAAALVGVNERTIYTWLEDPAFETAYRTARREAVQSATARLQQASGAAVVVLCQLMVNGTQSIKLSAAKTVLDLGMKSVELDDLAARLAALEQAHAEKL